MTSTYKIVKILDEYSVIINAGSENGIEVGDEFQILDTEGSEVRDPDTDEILGYLDLIKSTVRAIEVHEKMSFCETYYTASLNTNIFQNITSINNAFVAQKKKMKVDLTEITGGLRHSDAAVRVGDVVKKVQIQK